MTVPYAIGDVFLAIGNGQIKHVSPTGVLKNTLNTPFASQFTTGMCFDKNDHLFVTQFSTNTPSNSQISEFDSGGNWLGYFAPYSSFHFPESIIVDTNGDFYVGQASTATAPGVPADAHILKFDAAGTFLADFVAATETRGTDWIEIAECGDQCIVYYTSEGDLIKRYDVCNDVQLADFATLPNAAGPPTHDGGRAYALRVLPNGEMLVARGSVLDAGVIYSHVYHLDTTGAVIFTWLFTNSNLFSLNLDPDGVSFWTANLNTGETFRLNYVTHAVITSFTVTPNTSVGGIAVFGERRCFDFVPQIYRIIRA